MTKELSFDEEKVALEKELGSKAEIIAENKNYFAIQIKNGLGREMKESLLREKAKKKTFIYKLKKEINKILDKF